MGCNHRITKGVLVVASMPNIAFFLSNPNLRADVKKRSTALSLVGPPDPINPISSTATTTIRRSRAGWYGGGSFSPGQSCQDTIYRLPTDEGNSNDAQVSDSLLGAAVPAPPPVLDPPFSVPGTAGRAAFMAYWPLEITGPLPPLLSVPGAGADSEWVGRTPQEEVLALSWR